MSRSAGTRAEDDLRALRSRRKFLKTALKTAAYATPILVSYSSAVFATHVCGMMANMGMSGTVMCMGGMTFTPGCAPVP